MKTEHLEAMQLLLITYHDEFVVSCANHASLVAKKAENFLKFESILMSLVMEFFDTGIDDETREEILEESAIILKRMIFDVKAHLNDELDKGLRGTKYGSLCISATPSAEALFERFKAIRKKAKGLRNPENPSDEVIKLLGDGNVIGSELLLGIDPVSTRSVNNKWGLNSIIREIPKALIIIAVTYTVLHFGKLYFSNLLP